MDVDNHAFPLFSEHGWAQASTSCRWMHLAAWFKAPFWLIMYSVGRDNRRSSSSSRNRTGKPYAAHLARLDELLHLLCWPMGSLRPITPANMDRSPPNLEARNCATKQTHTPYWAPIAHVAPPCGKAATFFVCVSLDLSITSALRRMPISVLNTVFHDLTVDARRQKIPLFPIPLSGVRKSNISPKLTFGSAQCSIIDMRCLANTTGLVLC